MDIVYVLLIFGMYGGLALLVDRVGEAVMDVIVAGVLAALLLIYLVVALLDPERFQ